MTTTTTIEHETIPERSIEAGPIRPGQEFPLLVRPTEVGADLIGWAEKNQDFVERHLRLEGGVLFRDFDLGGAEGFERFIGTVAGEALEYTERSSPRSRVAGRVYTSTDYPPDQTIFLHNENSYQAVWPMKIFFYCETPPEEAGETPLADTRKVLSRISRDVREEFAAKGWSYVRNFQAGLGLSWEEVFGTSDRSEVEEYCRSKGIEAEWLDGGGLRTRAVRPAVASHPETGEEVWFNHATFFHVTTLPAEIRESLTELYAEEDLPTNTYYGDGSPIDPETLEALRAAYREETVMFPWQRGDVLMLDNMLVAHGRRPYSGPRKVVVGMADPMSWSELGKR